MLTMITDLLWKFLIFFDKNVFAILCTEPEKKENPPRNLSGLGSVFQLPQGSCQQTGPEKQTCGPVAAADHGAGNDDQYIVQDQSQCL